MIEEFALGDRVQLKKAHPCGSKLWTVIRTGADVKIRCDGCRRIVMLDRQEFLRRAVKVLPREDNSATPKGEGFLK